MAKNTIERFDAAGNVIPMTNEELDALDARRRRLFVIFGALGLVVAIVAVLALSSFLKIGLGSRSPLEKVTRFSSSIPVQVSADVLEYRLDQASGFEWGLTSWGRTFGKGQMDGTLEEGLDRFADDITLPADARITTVYTNLADQTSVSQNGRLVIVRLELPSVASDFLMTEPTVFSDSAVEALRDSYWSGAVIAFYSPAGAGEDRTYQVRKFLPEFATCPKNTKPCEPSPGLRDFTDWAPRAPLSKS